MTRILKLHKYHSCFTNNFPQQSGDRTPSETNDQSESVQQLSYCFKWEPVIGSWVSLVGRLPYDLLNGISGFDQQLDPGADVMAVIVESASAD